MARIRKSRLRIVIQETFKGYGKAINLSGSIKKALVLEASFPYFVAVLVIRGSASALFKGFMISKILRRPMLTKKAKRNFF